MRKKLCRFFFFLSNINFPFFQKIGNVCVRGIRPSSTTTQIFTGQKVYLVPRCTIDFHLYAYSIWEPIETAFFWESIWPGHDRVFDLGGHIGYYTLLALAAGASKVLTVEPSPESAARLRHNLRLNNLSIDCVKDFAVTRENGVFTLNISNESNTGRSSLGSLTDDFTYQVQVQGITLRDLIAQSRFDAIDVLKMDVEGAEFDVLEPAMDLLGRNDRVILLLGVHPLNLKMFRSSQEQVIKVLASAGFHLFRIPEEGRSIPDFQRMTRTPNTVRPYTLICLPPSLGNDKKFVLEFGKKAAKRLQTILHHARKQRRSAHRASS